MEVDVMDSNFDQLKPVGFNPEPVEDYLLLISEDRILQFGRRVYAALAASGYELVKRS